MARYAIGDIQGCCDELQALLTRCNFSADRDQLWFVGDLVNRGPQSLETLRFVRALGANATVVLGNHDLHLLALAYGSKRKPKDGDTLDAVLAAPDRDQLLEWLLGRPLAVFDEPRGDFLVHAGLGARVDAARRGQARARSGSGAARRCAHAVRRHVRQQAGQVERVVARHGPAAFRHQRVHAHALLPARWHRRLKAKGAPGEQPEGLYPWFDVPGRRSAETRVVCGHWSTLGLKRRPDLLALDTGCVWGGALTAVNLDADEPPIQLACESHQEPGGEG